MCRLVGVIAEEITEFGLVLKEARGEFEQGTHFLVTQNVMGVHNPSLCRDLNDITNANSFWHDPKSWS